jgi:hypothetical protein
VADGELQVALLVPEGCRVSGPNLQTLTVFAGRESRVAFDVHCA